MTKKENLSEEREARKRIATLIRELTGRPVLKLIEKVVIYPKGDGDNKRVKVLARIDTGASISSIDEDLAKNIGYEKVVRLDYEYGRIAENPRESVEYRTEKDDKEIALLESIPGVSRTAVIKSSHGFSRRVVVPIIFKIKGIIVETEASIISRAHLKYPLIIGRCDLRKFFIDPKTKRAREKFF